MRNLSLLVRGRFVTGALALVLLLGTAVEAAPRRVSFPTAFRPDSLNSVTVSPSAPVAFTASRETDTVFAFDPRTGARLGQVEVGDGPLFVQLREVAGKRTLA